MCVCVRACMRTYVRIMRACVERYGSVVCVCIYACVRSCVCVGMFMYVYTI